MYVAEGFLLEHRLQAHKKWLACEGVGVLFPAKDHNAVGTLVMLRVDGFVGFVYNDLHIFFRLGYYCPV